VSIFDQGDKVWQIQLAGGAVGIKFLIESLESLNGIQSKYLQIWYDTINIVELEESYE